MFLFDIASKSALQKVASTSKTKSTTAGPRAKRAKKQTKVFEQNEPTVKRKKRKKLIDSANKNERSILYLRGEYLALKTDDGMILRILDIHGAESHENQTPLARLAQ